MLQQSVKLHTHRYLNKKPVSSKVMKFSGSKMPLRTRLHRVIIGFSKVCNYPGCLLFWNVKWKAGNLLLTHFQKFEAVSWAKMMKHFECKYWFRFIGFYHGKHDRVLETDNFCIKLSKSEAPVCQELRIRIIFCVLNVRIELQGT